ncbi:MAG: c-type cytochrome [Nitrospirota bacterium]
MKRFLILPILGLYFLLLAAGCGGGHAEGEGEGINAKGLYLYYCSHCHGDKGNGQGYNAKNLDPTPRDHTDGEEKYMVDKSNEDLFKAVSKGGKAVGKAPLMPVFGNTLSEAEIWALVGYMRTLHANSAPKVTIPAEPEKHEKPKMPVVARGYYKTLVEKVTDKDKAAMIEKGEQLFKEKIGCIACHRVGGEGGTVGPFLDRSGFRLQPEYIFRWAKNPQAFLKNTKMPNFGLSDEDALAITFYLGTLKAGPKDAHPPVEILKPQEKELLESGQI